MRGIPREIQLLIVPTLAAVIVCVMSLSKNANRLEGRHKSNDPKVLDFYFSKIDEGKVLFKSNCDACHKLSRTDEYLDLQTVRNRMSDTLIQTFLLYPERTAIQNAYVHALYNAFNGIRHPAFLHILNKEDIDNIILYVACYNLKKY